MSILISQLALLVLLTANDDPMALVSRAYQLQQSGDYAGAAEAYRAFLKLRPDEVGAHSNLGVVLTKLGRYNEAIGEYEAAEKLLPGDPRIGVNLALAYEKSGRLTEATKKLEALHAAAPQEQQITMLLADAHLQAGENGPVVELLQPLEQQTPDDLAIAYLLGTALLRQQRIGEGQVLLDRILKNGDTAEARFLLGMQMYESGDYPASVKQFAAAAEVNPKLPELQAYYGQALLTTGDADGAADAFRRELAQNPNNFAANLGLGQILTVRKRLAEARPLLQQALVVRPDSIEAKLALGKCSGSLQLLQEVVRALPDSAEAHQELAIVEAAMHLTKEASHDRELAERLRQNVPGPKRSDPAPDFTLPDAATGKQVSLSSFHGKSPVVLIFGSYTCPNFRSSAGALKALQAKYGAQAPFLLIYIREAHGAGDWQSTRNEHEGVNLPQATMLSDKQDHAVMCSRTLHLPFPALLDGLDNKVETAYGAWPSRAFVIDRDGRIRYSTRLTELDFSASDMDAALRAVLP
jgi:tetratricopeptide (TPR) repeat protein